MWKFGEKNWEMLRKTIENFEKIAEIGKFCENVKSFVNLEKLRKIGTKYLNLLGKLKTLGKIGKI